MSFGLGIRRATSKPIDASRSRFSSVAIATSACDHVRTLADLLADQHQADRVGVGTRAELDDTGHAAAPSDSLVQQEMHAFEQAGAGGVTDVEQRPLERVSACPHPVASWDEVVGELVDAPAVGCVPQQRGRGRRRTPLEVDVAHLRRDDVRTRVAGGSQQYQARRR